MSGKIKSDEVSSYLIKNAPTSEDIYKRFAAEGRQHPKKDSSSFLHMFTNSTVYCVERGFSCMNLLCTKMRITLSQQSLDRLMRICINGPDSFTEKQLDELVSKFKEKNDNRGLEL